MSERYEVNEANPFGIHFLKFAVSLGLLGIHAVVWVAQAARFNFSPQVGWQGDFYSVSTTSLLVPLTAGAVQAISLRGQLSGGRLQGFALAPFCAVLAFLAFLESLKAALVYGPGIFFGWNVLHTIAVSLAVILLLAHYSVKWVAVSAVACLLLTLPLRAALSPWQIDSEPTIQGLHEIGVGRYLVAMIAILFFVASLVWLYRTPKFEARYKRRLGLCFSIAFNLLLLYIWQADFDPYTGARLLNLPVGALVGDRIGTHYWPLFPWYSSVAFGFLFYYWFPRTRYPREARLALWAVALLALAAYSAFFSSTVVGEVSSSSLWSTEIFAGSLGLLLMIFGVFLMKAALYDSLSRSARVAALIRRFPALYRVPFVYSKTILWSYLFVNSVAVFLARPFVQVLPLRVALFAYPIVIIVSWYWIGEFILRFLGRMRLQVRLSPARASSR